MKINGYQIVSESLAHDIVLVTGMSGSGKTTYSEKIATTKKYDIVHLDDKTKELLYKAHNIKSKEDINEWKKNHTVIQLFKEIDKYQLIALFQTLKNIKSHTIIEGTGIFKIKDITLLKQYKIYCMRIISLEETLKRKIKRYEQRGKTITDKKIKDMTSLYQYELPQYKKFIDKFKHKITII